VLREEEKGRAASPEGRRCGLGEGRKDFGDENEYIDVGWWWKFGVMGWNYEPY
jgi:hypothetical protein